MKIIVKLFIFYVFFITINIFDTFMAKMGVIFIKIGKYLDNS